MGKDCFIFVVISDLDLSLAAVSAQCGKHSFVGERVDTFVHTWDWMRAASGDGTEFVMVNANWKALSFLKRNTMGTAHSVCAGSRMLSASIFFNLVFPNTRVSKPARYEVKCISAVPGIKSPIQCFAMLMSSKCPSHLD